MKILLVLFSAALAFGEPIPGVHQPLRELQCGGRTYQEYTLGDRVTPGKPLLRDLFEGRAALAPLGAETITLAFTTPNVAAFDVKMPIFRVPGHPSLYAFARGLVSGVWSIFLMESTDHGLTFHETAGETKGAKSAVGNLTAHNNPAGVYDNQYDPTITLDYETCPPTYRVTAECTWVPTGEVDVCESHSQTPLDLASWSKSVPIVMGDNRVHSGSTGVLLLDPQRDATGRWQNARYVKWTDVQNSTHQVSTVIARKDALGFIGPSGFTGQTVLGVQPWPCQGWDCNNRDAQDWKREGDQYFFTYNGANYPGCEVPASGTNVWGVSFARAIGSPQSAYTLLPAPLLTAPRADTCGLSYPYVNVIDGEIYLYYAYYEAGGPAPGRNHLARSRLLFR